MGVPRRHAMVQSPRRSAGELRSGENLGFREAGREGAAIRSRQQFLVLAGSEEVEEECS